MAAVSPAIFDADVHKPRSRIYLSTSPSTIDETSSPISNPSRMRVDEYSYSGASSSTVVRGVEKRTGSFGRG